MSGYEATASSLARVSGPGSREATDKTGEADRLVIVRGNVSAGEDTRSELERRYGLESSDALLDRRHNLVAQFRVLDAKYGGSGYAGERFFKAEEAKLATVVRARFKEEGTKPTEGMVTEAVCGSDDYLALLTEQVAEKAEWIRLREELAEIEWRLKLRAGDTFLLGREAGLG